MKPSMLFDAIFANLFGKGIDLKLSYDVRQYLEKRILDWEVRALQ